ncbi:MAG TPA: AraC family transcriptional regulator [Bryobacteraceae bacterium]|nr:AraC family transcriptional regulator [Bryobacteraceae bacterium]
MDVLSGVLRTVSLQGALFFHGEFSAPWCFLSARASTAAPQLSSLVGPSPPERLIIFHFLTEGRAYARLPNGRREEFVSGDIVIIPHGDAHFIGNGSPEKPVDSFRIFAKHLSEGLKAVRFGGGGEITRFVCGFMACEPRLSEVFLAGLPRLLKVRVGSEPSGAWLEHSIRFSVDQASGSSAGSSLVVSKLSEVLFVEALRCYVNALPPGQTGWLAGTRDRAVGKALGLLHREPAHPWNIADLAQGAGLSRTRLAERFRHFLGESPMAYLAQWRLKLGADMLRSGDEAVAAVAGAVGYGSEAAFNRAFKREFGCPPAQFRRKPHTHSAQTGKSAHV